MSTDRSRTDAETSHESTGPADSGIVTIPKWAALLTSAVAVALAGVHVFVPSFRVDAATLALLAVAALPWLGPVIKSTRFGPFELNQLRVQSERLRRDVQSVSAKVEELHELIVTGATPTQEARLERDIVHYREYLVRVGVPGDLGLPAVHIQEEPYLGMAAAYADGAIYLIADVADSPTSIMREYTHHALRADERLRGGEIAPDRLIESGLAYYLPCSFIGDSCFSRGAGLYEHDLAQPPATMDSEASDGERYTVGGLQWAHLLWALHDLAGPAVIDPAVVSAWFAAEMMTTDDPGRSFLTAVISHLSAEDADRAAGLLVEYGVSRVVN